MAAALIDTHVHLSHRKYADDIDDVIARAKDAGVEQMMIPAIDVESIETALEIASRHDGIFVMAGIHPSHTKDAPVGDLERAASFVDHDLVVGVGESGLDYYWDRTFDEKQQSFLRFHIKLAISSGLPLILHNREASDDLIAVIADELAASEHPDGLRGIFHCFSGPPDVGRAAVDLGFHLGIGGNVTYKNSATREALASMPRERIVLETDGPFLAPVPFRGKRNEPSYVRYVAETVAEVWNCSVEEVAETTTRNARALFGV